MYQQSREEFTKRFVRRRRLQDQALSESLSANVRLPFFVVDMFSQDLSAIGYGIGQMYYISGDQLKERESIFAGAIDHETVLVISEREFKEECDRYSGDHSKVWYWIKVQNERSRE
jgi:hypothetical protein